MPQHTLAIVGAALFWGGLAFISGTYFAYPAAIALWARLRPRPIARRADYQPTISVVLASYNDAAHLPARIENLLALDYPADKLEIIAISDGSTDASAEILREAAAHEPRLHPVLLERNGGKAVALNAGLERATGELVLFADARQRFAPDVAARLAENFADPGIGSASGELVLTEGDAGVAAQVGLYWRYEKWIRGAESRAGSMLGATGAIYAIRRALYTPLPPGTLLDDFLTPMRIVLRGSRAIFDGRALAFDRASARAGQEFRRKVRTLAGNYQALAFEPRLLWPWSNPATWLQVWAHKLFRLWVPFAMAAMLLGAALATASATFGWFYGLMLAGQLAFYGAAAWGLRLERRGLPLRNKLVSLAYTFVTLNAAAAWGLWVWLRGARGGSVWQKAYQPPAGGPTPAPRG